MAGFRTPQQKKEQSYERDRVDRGEYPHADRKNRPRVKAAGWQQVRRASRQLLASQPEEVLQMPSRPRVTWRDRGIRLSEHVASTQRLRIEREAHNLFRRGYGPATHARFRRVVESWLKGGSEQSAALAEFYSSVLNRFPGEPQGDCIPRDLTERRYFLLSFFAKEPELKRRFQKWIASK